VSLFAPVVSGVIVLIFIKRWRRVSQEKQSRQNQEQTWINGAWHRFPRTNLN